MRLHLVSTPPLAVVLALLQLACANPTPTSPAQLPSGGSSISAPASSPSNAAATPYRRVGDVGGGGNGYPCSVGGEPTMDCPDIQIDFSLRAADGSTLSTTCVADVFASDLTPEGCSFGVPGEPHVNFVGTERLEGAGIPPPNPASSVSPERSFFTLSESSLYVALLLRVPRMGTQNFFIRGTLAASTQWSEDEGCASGIRVVTRAAGPLEQLGRTTVELHYCTAVL